MQADRGGLQRLAAERLEPEDVAEVAVSGWDAMILRCTEPGNS
ncbi:hypothetical protein [Nitratireductor sp. ZSWI3]|nr:hypothetical protein [Nitratireductor sp. ZSWI3]MCR4265063.1 hypothetical protein [Nitratireductor sp. ZSWI3]